MNEQEERLNQELKFLKESLDADIISEEEYIKGKERIERELDELNRSEMKESNVEDGTIKENSGEEKAEVSKVEEEKAGNAQGTGVKKIGKGKDSYDAFENTDSSKPNRKFLIIAALVIFVILIYFIWPNNAENIPVDMPTNDTMSEGLTTQPEEINPACNADKECKEEGKIGICLNGGTKDARCEFLEPVETSLTIINDKNCKECDTNRMLSILKQLFPAMKSNNLEYSSEEGKLLIKEMNIQFLPAYIFDSNVEGTISFNKFKSALIKKGENWLIDPAAAGSNLILDRKEINAKLDLYFIPDEKATKSIENSLADVTALFGDKITLEKHEAKESFKEDLGITSYPLLLINNQFKLLGVQSPETIKTHFCEFNDFEECNEKLKESID